MTATLQRLVESAAFQRFIVAVIVVNAITLGLPAKELAARRKAWKRRPDAVTRGVLAKFRALVTTASRGAVTDAQLG